jgi:hypothetical protein
MLKQPLIRLAVLALMLLGSALAFYLISPLFVQATFGSDGWPTLGYMPTRTVRPATATQTPEDTATALPVVSESEVTTMLEGEGALLLAQGDFYNVAHIGQGAASLYEAEGFGLVLRLEGFSVEDGPDLHVYLTSQNPVENFSGSELPDGFDLGVLKNISGDQIYDIPEDLNLRSYSSVVIWCVPFQVPFIAAYLDAP